MLRISSNKTQNGIATKQITSFKPIINEPLLQGVITTQPI